MARMTLTVEGTEMTLELLARAIAEKSRTTICPESIFPGYSLDVVEVSEVTEVAVKRIVLPHRLTEEYPDMKYGEYDLDALAMTFYEQRSHSSRTMTEADWENVKARFPGSAKSCYEDVLDAIESGELDG